VSIDITQTSCRQPANNVTGNSNQAGLSKQSDSASKRALELGNLIKQEIETLDQFTKAKVQSSGIAVQHSEADAQSSGIAIQLSDVAVELSKAGIPFPYAAAQLSNPAFQTKLPFPFVGAAIPGRFKPNTKNGHDEWFYTGRERFTELLERLQDMLRRSDLGAFWVYGTRGYGKSHLLAALVCHLSAGRERVVYIPDCRECYQDPIPYLQAAMLFAWADDDNMQREILCQNTWEEINGLFKGCKNVIFVIDEMNALEVLGTNDADADEKKDLHRWLNKFRKGHKAVLSCSANYQTYLRQVLKKTSESTMHVNGGLTPVSFSSIAKGGPSNFNSEGNGAVVETASTLN
jgi:hypothetical protein